MLFSRNLLCAGIILISHGAYAMHSSSDGMPGNVLAVLEEKEFEFTTKTLGIAITDKGNPCPSCTVYGHPTQRTPFCDECGGCGTADNDNKVMVDRVSNLECKAEGIFRDSQLLSVNGTPVTTQWDALRLIRCHGIVNINHPIKMVFMCPKSADVEAKQRQFKAQLQEKKQMEQRMKQLELEYRYQKLSQRLGDNSVPKPHELEDEIQKQFNELEICVDRRNGLMQAPDRYGVFLHMRKRLNRLKPVKDHRLQKLKSDCERLNAQYRQSQQQHDELLAAEPSPLRAH